MRTILITLSLAILLIGCNNAQKSLQKGQYDLAIAKAVKKLQRKPNDIDALSALEEAFNRAVERDDRRIEFLKKEGKPDNWDQIFSVYQGLNSRQERVRSLLNIPAGITFKNYDNDLIGSKEKAAEYYYAHAVELMKVNDRQSARQAYNEFVTVKSYYQNFRDVDTKMIEAREMGTSNVIFSMENKTGVPLPPEFEQDLKKISLTELNKDWLRYHINEQGGLFYDYTLLVNMKVIDVAPESVKELQYEESKKVRDGWEYVLDDKGNVKKDSLGNDIKIPKYKTITCKVIEKQQFKKAIISGSIDYINNRTNELMHSDPIASESVWQHRSGLAIGDVNALKPETKPIIGIAPVPFPNDFSLLLDAGERLKIMTKDIVYRNKNIFY